MGICNPKTAGNKDNGVPVQLTSTERTGPGVFFGGSDQAGCGSELQLVTFRPHYPECALDQIL